MLNYFVLFCCQCYTIVEIGRLLFLFIREFYFVTYLYEERSYLLKVKIRKSKREVADTSRCIQIQIQAKNVSIFCRKTKTDTLFRPGFTGFICGIFTLFKR